MVPIEVDSRHLDLLDVYHQSGSRNALPHPVVIDRHHHEDSNKQRNEDYAGGSSGVFAKHQGQQSAANEEHPSDLPVFSALRFELLCPSIQPRNRMFEASRTINGGHFVLHWLSADYTARL